MTHDQPRAAVGAGNSVALPAQTQVIRLPGEKGGALDGRLALASPGAVERSGFGVGIESEATHHTPAMRGDVLQVTAQERLGGERHLGGLALPVGVEPIADPGRAHALDLPVLERAPAHIAGEVFHHPLAMGIALLQVHVPFRAVERGEQPLEIP